MAQARPPFDFDLNELPPEEEDGAKDAASPDPAREPLQQDPPSEREPSPQDLPPPPDLDLEAPLSPLDEDEDDADDWQLPGPSSQLPPEPEPRGSSSGVAPSRSPRSSGEAASDDDSLAATRLPDPPSRRGERTSPRTPLPDSETTERSSSQETPAPRSPSRGPSDTTMSSQRSRHMPPYYVPRDDDAISKRRRGGGYYDEDAASYSHGGGSRTGGPTSPRRDEQTGGRRLATPAIMNGEIGGRRPRNRRRRRPYGGNQNYGHDQRMQQGYRAREQPQRGFRGQERLPSGHHQAYHGPHHGNAPPNISTPQQGSSDYRPSYSGPHGKEDSYHRRQNQVQEPPKTGAYQHREALPFSGRHGREGSYGRRHSRVQEPPKIGGYHQHREAPSFSSPYQAHGREDSFGGRPNPAAQERGPNANGAYQQREAPRRRGQHVPVRPYHPDALDGAGNQARHESRPNNYQHRRDDARNKTGGAERRSRRPYGEAQK